MGCPSPRRVRAPRLVEIQTTAGAPCKRAFLPYPFAATRSIGPPMSALAIEVHDLRMRYGGVEAVRGIDLEVASGEVFGFLGPNGAGKTTTIEILEGYRPRTSGDGLGARGRPGGPDARVARPHRPGSPGVRARPPAHGRGDALAVLRLLFAGRGRSTTSSTSWASRDKVDERVGRLSGGQRRRVDVGVALIGDPELVFLDEPTTGFDPAARREAWAMIEGLKALGKTVFLTTHYMDEAQHLADRVAILRAGRIVAEGRPDELADGNAAGTIVTFRRSENLDLADLRAACRRADRGRRRRRRDPYRRHAGDPGPAAPMGRRARCASRTARGAPPRPRGDLPRTGRRRRA